MGKLSPTGVELPTPSATPVTGTFTAVGVSAPIAVYGMFNAAIWGQVNQTLTTNGTTTATVGSATGLAIGQTVVSANVPAGTVIVNLVSTTLTLSVAATATGADAAALFVDSAWAGTVNLERSFDGGATYTAASLPLSATKATFTASANFWLEEPEYAVYYRWNCTVFTSGVIRYRISASAPFTTNTSM